jgi:hypothetical protein
MSILNIDQTIENLPDEAKKELLDFAEFLKQKYLKEKKHSPLKLTWAGKLEQYKDKLGDPVALQHEISDLWGGSHVPR